MASDVPTCSSVTSFTESIDAECPSGRFFTPGLELEPK